MKFNLKSVRFLLIPGVGWFWVLCSVFALSINAYAANDNLKVKAYHYPVSLERDPISLEIDVAISDFILTFPVESLNITPNPGDSSQDAMDIQLAAKVYQGIAEDNYESIIDHIEIEGSDGSMPTMKKIQFFKRHMSSKREFYSKAKITGRTRLGNRVYLQLSGPKNEKWLDRLLKTPKGTYRYLWWAMPRFDGLLLATHVQGKEMVSLGGVTYDDKGIRQLAGYHSFLLKTGKTPSKKSLVLHFKGKPYFQKVSKPIEKGAPDILFFYQKAMKTWKKKNKDEIFKLYGPESRKALSEMLSDASPKTMDTFGDSHYRRVIRYVVNADPVYLVFFNEPFTEITNRTPFGYEIVQRVGEKDYQIVNVNIKTRLKGFFEDHGFVEKAIKTRLINSPN
jgi:hypothetical protein